VDYFKLGPLPPEHALAAGTAAVTKRQDTVSIPVFWIVLLLSVLLHAVVLYFLPPLSLMLPPAADLDAPIAVELRPRVQPPPGVPAPPSKLQPPVAPPPLAAAPRTPPPAPPAARRAPPPVIARPAPAPDPIPAPAQPEPPQPERAQTPNTGDLASYIEARRRNRPDVAQAPARPSPESLPEDDAARNNRIVAANLGLGQTPTFGGKPRRSGGAFHVTRLTYSDAEFLFYGWSKDIQRNTSQLIEVRKGQHSDIKLAVVRRMIAIIREHESGDFRWDSQRLEREVILSARPSDNAGLEEFLLSEFF